MRGKRQMFPVPTAIPSIASSMPQRELNTSDLDAIPLLPCSVIRRIPGGRDSRIPGGLGFPCLQDASRSRR